MQLGKIASGLKDLPVNVEYQIDWGLDDLIDLVRGGVFPIVALDLRPVEGRDAYHAAVVVDVTSDQMVVHDPLQEKGPRTISRSTFDVAWIAADREAVIITSAAILFVR